jgi:DNA-directed RNA polymerase sigma subunit (sigma70/sigma32)
VPFTVNSNGKHRPYDAMTMSSPNRGRRVTVLCRRWHDRHDITAADRLARGHRQLVVGIAATYTPAGPPSPNLVAEGQLGLMRAICRFDPDGLEGFCGVCGPPCVTA